MTITVGDKVSHDFTVDEAAMVAFQSLSGDVSRIHTDNDFARSRGYDGVIVYGGIMLAHLSHVLGMRVPGPNGASMRWQIDYRRPLYVGEPARIDLEVVNISPGSGVVEARYKITAGKKTVATGQTQSIVPPSDLGDGT